MVHVTFAINQDIWLAIVDLTEVRIQVNQQIRTRHKEPPEPQCALTRANTVESQDTQKMYVGN